MLSIFKKAKPILRMKPEEKIETSLVVTMLVLVALVKRQIGKGSSNT